MQYFLQNSDNILAYAGVYMKVLLIVMMTFDHNLIA